MIAISNDTLKIILHEPDGVDGYYRATRFDWAGVFRSIEYRGRNYSEEWFESYSPLMHDAVCGPTEEFSPIGIDDVAPGEAFLKIGVGMLEKMEGKYDRFRLHKVIDFGRRMLCVTDNSVVFGHFIGHDSGYGYEYIKEITLTGENSFRISHSLRNTGGKVLSGNVYNHNFFTLGLFQTSPTRQVDFLFRPEGDWRAEYSEVGFEENGIRFRRPLLKGESVYVGNIHEAGRGMTGSPYSFELRDTDTGCAVKALCTVPMTKAVFWANHRIACVEPYIDFSIAPGETFSFDICYILG